jgi:hypothetical protein
MKHMMVDLETFGNQENKLLCQIGACYFNPYSGEIGNKFKINIDAVDAEKFGLKFDASTVYWWLAQSKEAQESVCAKGVGLVEALESFNKFAKDCKHIWSHATFDFVTLQETYRIAGVKPSYGFRAARDLRTIVTLAGISIKDFIRDGVHHDGLEDAIFQVKYCSAAWNRIKKRVDN